MNVYIVLASAFALSVAFHFIGVYAGAKKIVWLVIVLLWAAGINIAMSEIKPKGYDFVEKIKGQYPKVDDEINRALPEISIYEIIGIRKVYKQEKASSEN
ncbi:MAG: hypothetical protein U9R50_03285 [Campylobacterota bacterium]|nr:hypothetical protein [Campylobacterota bacterium]